MAKRPLLPFFREKFGRYLTNGAAKGNHGDLGVIKLARSKWAFFAGRSDWIPKQYPRKSVPRISYLSFVSTVLSFSRDEIRILKLMA